MNNKQYIFLLILVAILFIPIYSHAKRNNRRKNSITQALQNIPQDSPFITEPTQLASLDKISMEFEKSRGEVSREMLSEPLATEEIPTVTITTLKEQTDNYSLPLELKQKATQDLAKVEEKDGKIIAKEEEKITLQFEEADLQTFVQQISDIFHVTFISDSAIEPLPAGSPDAPTRSLKGNKISFKTSSPVTRQQAWDLFITFLNISGFSIVQQPDPSIYRIETIKAAQKAPLATFIGVNYETLPDNDSLIRYLYFIENSTVEAMRAIIPSLQSTSATAPIFLQDQKAFLLTDKSYNIKSLMKIVKELDKVTMPQAMSVLKLRQADAVEVKKLYDELTQQTEEGAFRPFGARKQPTAIYFPENARIIAEPRTNSLVLLGPKDAIAKIEDFIIKHVDVALDQPYSPLYTYQLQYADATTIAEIMNNITKIGAGTEAGKAGGVRGQDKYLREMVFTPEPSNNKLIIKGDYNDYLIAREVIQQLDEPQPQVAIEVLILSVETRDIKELGTQLRSKVPGLDGILGQNVRFQTSGLFAGGSPSGIVTNPDGAGVNRLLGNLLQLVTNAPIANTIITFGQDIFGVWGLFQALRTLTNLQVISNPFLVASNKTPAHVSLGETRRVVSGTIISGDNVNTNTFEDDKAELKVDIQPQINSDGMIIMKLRVELTEFTDPTNPNSGNKTTRLVQTQAIVADREVLALGGLIRNTSNANMNKTPILGDIPVLGWLFKNKQKTVDKTSLLILMSTKIIPPQATGDVNKFTQERLSTYRSTLGDIAAADPAKDPIHRLFFSDATDPLPDIGEFLFDRQKKGRRRGRRRRKVAAEETAIAKNNTRTNQAATPLDIVKTAASIQSKGTVDKAIVNTPPITIAQSNTLQTIAAPSASPVASLKDKKRKSQSLSNYLSTSTPEKSV
jgi:general secretion pathway protein D